MTNFNEDIDIRYNIETTFKNHKLVLLKPYKYFGPITLQYLPYGGIQSLYDNQIILTCKNGFIASRNIIYDGKELTAKEFIDMFDNLINEILPS